MLRYVAAAAALGALGTTGWQLHRSTYPAKPAASGGAAPPAGAPADAGTEPLDATTLPATAELPPHSGTAPCGERETAAPCAAVPSPPMPSPGAYAPPPVIIDGQPRIYPLTRNVWVRPTPSSAHSWIGFLWFGSSVRIREAEGQRGPGCKGNWYAIEPRGYVCADDDRATADPEHPALAGVTAYAPNLSAPWPHRYGESIDLERYVQLPSARHQRAREWYHRSHQALVTRAREGEVIEALLGIDLSLPSEGTLPLAELPRTLQMGHSRLKARSTVAWSREQLHEGRSFLLTADFMWVPKDRVKPYPTVTFHGVRLGRDAQLPLAFFRKQDRPSYRRAGPGEFTPSGSSFERLSWVELTGNEERVGEDTFLETRSAGLFVRRGDAVIPQLAERTPWRTPLGETESDADNAHRTWMEASIMGGWLLAYEGHTPVFATLVSAGRGGPPQGDIDPVETASTPVGRFKITGKFATATMIAPNELTHSDVPWAQNFSGPHALHAAYWHDRWGELKSGGCLNVSPRDGRYLFYEFTQPRVPEGWHGVRWDPDREPATTLIVRR